MLAALLNFFIAIVISQALGDTGKGVQALLLATISFILIFSDIVCGESIVFLAPRHSFKKIWVASVVWAAFVAVVMGLSIKVFYPALDVNMVSHVALLSFVSSLSSINYRFLVGREEIRKANYNTMLQPVVMVIVLLLYYVILKKRDIYGYVVALYAAYISSFLLGVWMLRNEYRHLFHSGDHAYSTVLKDLFKYGFLNQTGHFVQFFNLRLSYYLLTEFVDVGRVGVFSNAVSLAEAVWIISSSIALVQYARIANAENRSYAQKLTLDLGKICLLFSLLAVVALCLLPPSVYQFVFGPGFGEMAGIIRILSPGILFYCLFLILGHYYSGIGRYQMNTLASICGLVVTFVCGFTLIPRYDVVGAAITSAISYMVTALFLFVFFLKESHFKGQDFILTRKEWKNHIVGIKQFMLKQHEEK